MKSTAHRNKFLLRIILLFSLLGVVGCAKRQLETTTIQMDVSPRFWIRVLLLDDVKTVQLSIPSSFTIINSKAQIQQARFEQFEGPIETTISNGKITIARWLVDANEVIISPDKPNIFTLNGSEYRGKLKLVLHRNRNSFDAVNLVPLEPYLAGVIGAEMPDYWEPQALMAQAVAARTYCLYIKKRFGVKRHWDLKKTQAHQTYHGIKAESAQIWNAIKNSWGQVMTCKQPNGSTDLFPTYYSSACGGHTENSKNVFGGDYFEPLDAVPCPYCEKIARPDFFLWPTVQIDKTELNNILMQKYQNLKKLDKIIAITAVKKSEYKNFSRLTMIKLTGSTGKSDFLRAEDLRLSIDPTGMKIKSTICKIVDKNDKWSFEDGRGFGHGVGMCQCGAQQLARQGKNAKQILSYYYHGSNIKNIYDD